MLDRLFVLLSYGVLNGAAVRMRTQMLFMLVVLFAVLDAELVLFRLLGASGRQGSVCLSMAIPLPWVIGRCVEPYVDRNWHLFSPASKRVPYLWAGRLAAYLLVLSLLLAFLWSGIAWGKAKG